MIWAIELTGTTETELRASLDAAITKLRDDMLICDDDETKQFYKQSQLRLTLILSGKSA